MAKAQQQTTEATPPTAAEEFALSGGETNEQPAAEAQEGGRTRGRRMVLDAEIAAMQDIADILDGLDDEETRLRVIGWMNSRFDVRWVPNGRESLRQADDDPKF